MNADDIENTIKRLRKWGLRLSRENQDLLTQEQSRQQILDAAASFIGIETPYTSPQEGNDGEVQLVARALILAVGEDPGKYFEPPRP